MPTSVPPQAWLEADVETASPAKATHAGEPGKLHYVTHISASISGGPALRLRLRQGNGGLTTLDTWYVGSYIIIDRQKAPIEVPAGQRVRLVLDAGGEGVIGTVNLRGYTEEVI